MVSMEDPSHWELENSNNSAQKKTKKENLKKKIEQRKKEGKIIELIYCLI
jgi:hypothetical protein